MILALTFSASLYQVRQVGMMDQHILPKSTGALASMSNVVGITSAIHAVAALTRNE